MLLRTEAINLLAEKAGVPQLEAARFMEIFLYKLSELLLEGDHFKIADFGDFVISSQQKGSAKNQAAGKIFLFTPLGESGSVTFGAPTSYSASVSPLDQIFTLGINRRFIPVRGESYSSDGLPSGTEEMRKYLEQHAGLLLQEGTFLRASRPGSKQPVEEDELSSEAFLPFNTPKMNVTKEVVPEPEETSWEFGSDWKKEYEEDLLLESGDESAESSGKNLKPAREPENSGWDFGEEEEIKPKAKQQEEDYTPRSKKAEEAKKSKAGEEPEEFSLENFAPVRSMTRELEIDLSEFETPDEEEFEEEHEEEPEEEEEEEDYEDDIIPEDFDSLFKKSLAENVMMAGSGETESPSGEDGDEEGHGFGIDTAGLGMDVDQSEDDFTGLSRAERGTVDLRGQRLSKHISPEEQMEFAGIRDTIERRSAAEPQKSYIGYYLVAFVLLTAAGLLVYSKLYGMPEWAAKILNKKEPEIQLKASPTVIERDYAFPVSYPYDKITPVLTPQPIAATPSDAKETVKEEPKQEPAKQEPVKQEPVKQTKQEPVVKEKPKKVEPPPVEDKSKKLSSVEYKGAFIDPTSKSHEIQVMSLGPNDKASAEKAASRLRSMGFNSFVTEKEIPKKGVVNRVRVGPFSSQAEAEKALRKIKGE